MDTTPQILSLTEAQFRLFRETLLTTCGREQQLFAFLSRSGHRLLVSRVFLLSEDDYTERSSFSVEWDPEFRMGVRLALETERPDAVLDLHSHPFSRCASFSTIDAREHARRFLDFRESDSECLFVRGVFGQREDGFTLESFPDPKPEDFEYLADGSGCLVSEIEVIGDGGIRRIRSFRAPRADVGVFAEAEFYQRNAVTRTDVENARLSAAHVVVVGAGGLGAELTRLILMAGVRQVAVIDSDELGPENFNRLDWARPSDVGRPKVARLVEYLRDHDPGAVVEGVVARFPSASALSAMEGADLVLVGVDDDRVRFNVLRWCVRHLRPALDAGSGISLSEAGGREAERSGHVWMYLPGQRRCWMHMGLDTPLLWDEGLRAARKAAGYVVDAPTLASPGSVQTLNALVAAWAVAQAEQILLGRHPGPDLTEFRIDVGAATRLQAQAVSFHSDPECPLCGDLGFEGVGGDPFGVFPPVVEGEAGEGVEEIPKHPSVPTFLSVAGAPEAPVSEP